MTLDESTDKNDVVTASNGLTIVYEKDLGEYLDDLEIDFEDSWYGQGFSLHGSQLGSC